MPMYEYQCKGCNLYVSKLQKVSSPAPECSICSKPMKKMISLSSFNLKGSGWAKDNYGLKKR